VSKVKVLLNPQAGQGRRRDQLRDAAASRDWLDLVETEHADHAGELTVQACDREVDIVVAAGGDGTVNQVVNAMMQCEHRPALGIVPVGSANDFAGAMGIPSDLNAALDLLREGTRTKVDLMRVENDSIHYLLNAATLGLSVHIHDAMDDQMKRFWGRFAYVRAAIDVVPDAQIHRFDVELDDGQEQWNVIGVVLSNGPRVGGVRIAPEADPTDGLIDVVALQPLENAENARVLFEFVMGNHTDDETVIYRRVRKLTLRSQPVASLIGDGEECGRTPMTIQVVPGAIDVIMPPR